MAINYSISILFCLLSLNYVSGYFEPKLTESKKRTEVQKDRLAFNKINAIHCILNSGNDESFNERNDLKDYLFVSALQKIIDLDENMKLIPDMLKKITNIEDNFNIKVEALERKLMSKLTDTGKEMPELKLNTHLEKIIEKTLFVIEKVLESTEKSNHELELLRKRVPELDGNVNQTLGAIEKIFESIENINLRLDTLENKLPELQEYIPSTMLVIEKFPESTEKSNDVLSSPVTKIPELDQSTNQIQSIEKIPESSEQSHPIINVLEEKTPELELKEDRNYELSSYNSTVEHTPTDCKEFPAKLSSYIFDDFYAIDNETLHNVALNKEKLKMHIYFEMHISIKAAEAVAILLSPIRRPSIMNNDLVFEIGIGTVSNTQTSLKLSFKSNPVVKTVRTVDILSATRYVNFYIKISNDTLTFGKEGDSTPVLTYEDARVNRIKYFAFSHWTKPEAKILFDCPAL